MCAKVPPFLEGQSSPASAWKVAPRVLISQMQTHVDFKSNQPNHKVNSESSRELVVRWRHLIIV